MPPQLSSALLTLGLPRENLMLVLRSSVSAFRCCAVLRPGSCLSIQEGPEVHLEEEACGVPLDEAWPLWKARHSWSAVLSWQLLGDK